MTATIQQQLACARAVLEQMQRNNSRWTKAQEAIVHTLEVQLDLERITFEMTAKEAKEAQTV